LRGEVGRNLPCFSLAGWHNTTYDERISTNGGQGNTGVELVQAVVDNPIINSPYKEPTRQFKFNDEGITNEIESGRRVSSYFISIAQPQIK
jgi:hypothetical protein